MQVHYLNNFWTLLIISGVSPAVVVFNSKLSNGMTGCPRKTYLPNQGLFQKLKAASDTDIKGHFFRRENYKRAHLI